MVNHKTDTPVDYFIVDIAGQQINVSNTSSLEIVSETRTYYDLKQAFGYVVEIPTSQLIVGTLVKSQLIQSSFSKELKLIGKLKKKSKSFNF